MNKIDNKYLEIDGSRIHYLDEGQGETILLLPGWSRMAGDYKEIISNLSSLYRVIVPSFPGVRKSSRLPKNWDFESYVELSQKLVERLNLERVILIGHSFGGAIALKLSIKIREKVQKILLISPAGIKVKRSFFSWLGKWLVKNIRDLFRPGMKTHGNSFYHFFFRFPDLLKSFQITASVDLQNELQNVSAPVVILWAEKDDYFPLENARILEKGLPNAKLNILQGLAHDWSFLKPEIIKQYL